MSREGVTQGDPLLMALYGITLVPLAEKLQAANLGLLTPLYADDAAFDGLSWRISQLLKLLFEIGTGQGYFPDPTNSLFIANFPEK